MSEAPTHVAVKSDDIAHIEALQKYWDRQASKGLVQPSVVHPTLEGEILLDDLRTLLSLGDHQHLVEQCLTSVCIALSETILSK